MKYKQTSFHALLQHVIIKPVNYRVTLPDGTEMDGKHPLVVLGPNGSGKTQQTRLITSKAPIDFINALRNTRVNPQIPAMGLTEAKNNYINQKNQSKTQPWEITTDFDFLLAQLLADEATQSMNFTNNLRKNPGNTVPPPETSLSKVSGIWSEIFPGRELVWKEWSPFIVSTVANHDGEYNANTMSDGEKAALYLAGKIFSIESGIVVIDEPETHLHSQLAVKLWNILEKARADLRFIYVTHDLTFALSRSQAQYVLASPEYGLKPLEITEELDGDVAEVLLGSASLSFYAKRIVFCEGEESGWDNGFYNAWFGNEDTVVRSVGSCEMVMRCTDALLKSGIASSLNAVGIIDRDYIPDTLLTKLPSGVIALELHEVESLLCMPLVVEAVAQYLRRPYDKAKFTACLETVIDDSVRHKTIVERWKRRLEPNLETLLSDVSTRRSSVDQIVKDIPTLFDYTNWTFSPEAILVEEKNMVESTLKSTSLEDFLTYFPGKAFLAATTTYLGVSVEFYTNIVTEALKSSNDSPMAKLHINLEQCLINFLPPRNS